MKKILHIQVLPKMAGVQWVSYHILQSLSNVEYEKHILFSSDMDDQNKSHCKKLFESIGCKVIFLDSLKRSIGIHDFKGSKDIYKLCRKEKYDIVHTNSTKPGVIGRIAATMARVPFVVHTVHGLAFYDSLPFPKWQFYWACEMFASIFCNKISFVNKYYQKYFRIFHNKILTIYNGIDFQGKNSPITNVSQSDKIKVLFVGRLSTAKDPITMIKAFSQACEKVPNMILTIVGDGEYYEKCKSLVDSLQIQDKVIFEGWQNDVIKYYSSHDIFITTSIYEAFGLVFLDAGFYKLPVVATNVEGIPEVVADKVTGLLANPRDVKEISNNIVRLALNRDLREQMGRNAFKRVTENFSVRKMTEAYKRLYEEGVSLKGRS